ncbi:MAG: nucleotide pyrophosphohydrolase [Patescibacteria group bacterium]|nr:nucleotide pyrophosphohydrolase [Patescibacteria group bacterium]
MQIRKKYEQLEIEKFGRKWNGLEQTLGFVTDVGELAEIAQIKEGIRDGEIDIDTRLAHELSDCLWSVIVIANTYGIDIEHAFLTTMDELENRFS